MIVTVTLNPAVDRTIKVEEINEKDVTRVKKTIRDAAGKGINVSKVICSLGGTTFATGFLGGSNGAFIQKELLKLKVPNDFVLVKGETRENMKIHETLTNRMLELNESGPLVNDSDVQKLLSVLDKMLHKEDVLVLSGSIPQGLDKNIYEVLIKRYRSKGIITILDTSLDLLKEGIKGNPNIIKPNLYELEQLVGKKLHSDDEIVAEARMLCKNGIDEVIVTLGKDGAILVNLNESLKIDAPSVKVESTVGAGDSFVGGISYSIDQGYGIEKRLKFATAVASASVMSEGTNPGKKEDIERLIELVQIRGL